MRRRVSASKTGAGGTSARVVLVDSLLSCSLFVLMAVETLGEAWQLGWRITARCAFGNSDGMRSIRSCIYHDLDLRTPDMDGRGCVSTFELAGPAQMRCGSRRVALSDLPQAGVHSHELFHQRQVLRLKNR
jgi:hypothetical protein